MELAVQCAEMPPNAQNLFKGPSIATDIVTAQVFLHRDIFGAPQRGFSQSTSTKIEIL